MPAASAEMATATSEPSTSTSTPRKAVSAPEKKYKCQFCNRAFSRSEHRSRHERSRKSKFLLLRGAAVESRTEGQLKTVQPANFDLADTKERPFQCTKCRSTFVRRDLLLRHDRTVHAKDPGIPLVSGGRKRGGTKSSPTAGPSKASINIDPATLEQLEASSDGMLDLETAAMLMTDFQHKAAAAANGHLHDGEDSMPTYSPDRSLLEPPVDYLSGSATLPQMPWDTFMSQPPSEPKSHSMTSSMSSQDTHMSQSPYVHMGSIQPHQTQLPPLMDRQGSLNHALAPQFPSLTDSFPVSGSPTPNALSPYPSMTGPVSPVNYRRSPGPSQALTLPKAPQVTGEEERSSIANQISDADISLPPIETINLYLSTYFNLFHHHLPFLHPVSFKPGVTEPALLLAVLSIGALYNFDQEQAYVLHHGSKKLANEFLQNKDNFDSRKCPLWMMQSTLLNMLFESWSGGAQALEWACSIKGLLSNVSSSVAATAMDMLIKSADGGR
jgi:transposase-like protein